MSIDLSGLTVEETKPGMELQQMESPLVGMEVQGLSEGPPPTEESEWDYPLRDWEKQWAEKSHAIYPLARTISNLVPYASLAIFPSARDAYERKTTGGQTLELGLEALGLVPAVVIGKGLKAVAQGARLTGGFLAKPITKMLPKFLKGLPDAQVMANPFADELMSDVVKYVHVPVKERLASKYGLLEDEIQALAKGQQSVWRSQGRSGAFVPEKTEALSKLFTKEGTVKKEVIDDVKAWTRPVWEQELRHYENQANRVFARVAGTEYKTYDVFKTAAVRVYGEAGKNLKLDNISLPELGNLMKDVLEHGTAYRKALDISGWSQLKPTRKVFGASDLVWNTYGQLYKPVKNLLRATNIAEINYVRAWHGILAGRKVGGEALLKMRTNKLGETILKENYSAKEFSNAGKLATDIDYAQSVGKAPAEVQALMDSAPPKVQAIAKSLHDWYDWMYSDFAQNRIPQLFKVAGLTKKGEDAILGIMSRPGGVTEMINGALRAGNNLGFKEKQLVVENALKSLKQMVSKENLNWFTDKPLKAMKKEELGGLVEKLKNLQSELTFRTGAQTKGFPNYIENYTARLPKEVVKPWTAEGGLPAEMHAGFTKPRLLEEPGFDLKTDIPSLIGGRARMQAKELFLYPDIDNYREFVSRLPKNLKDYSTHWMNRILGIPSPVDTSVARWLSRFSTKGWDERRVVDVAQKINDLTYLGGIGFKPFSALRNYIQTPLMVPGDLGGIKNQVWLAAGAKKAFESSTREFIRSIGAIQEFAPDLAYNLKISKHGEGFLDKARDFGMWMFKASDRHNRYWTGGAAMAKWEHYFSKYGENGAVPLRNLDSFKSKLGTASREAWIRKDLDELMKIGTPESFLEAKKLFVNDVISDTQYLYGLSESPLIGYKWGAPGRVSLVFQSWWMNYADALSKWIYRTPEVEGKLVSATNERLFNFMLSSAIAYSAMEPIWGARTAITSVGTGPLPTLSIPPTWKPFLDGFRLIADSIMLPISGDLDKVGRASVQMLKDAAIFMPGGIQTYQMIQGARKEGLPGVLKSIVKYQPDKEKQED